jgi:hypothetical protein
MYIVIPTHTLPNFYVQKAILAKNGTLERLY